MKRVKTLLLVFTLVMSMVLACACDSKKSDSGSGNQPAANTGNTSNAKIKVGVVNNPPSESGYREANVKDMEAVFSAEWADIYRVSYPFKIKQGQRNAPYHRYQELTDCP